MIGLPEDGGWAGGWADDWAQDVPDGQLWAGALSAGRPNESGGGGGRRARGARDGRDERDDDDSGRSSGRDTGNPEDRPWTPIPRQAKAAERGLIPTQRRLKKTSRSA